MKHDMITVEEARTRAIALAREARFATPEVELDLLDSLGHVVTKDLVSDMDVAPFDNTAMDGFAVVKSALDNASPEASVTLDIIDWIGAGAVSSKVVDSGSAIRIMTGGIMPEGADAVVKIEDVTMSGEGGIGDTVTFTAPVKKTNVRKAGEEAKKGEIVVKAGEVVNAATIGLLASTGNMRVPVYARPKVGIISIGTELVMPPAMPGPGKIRNSNGFVLAAYARELGCEAINYPIVEDDEASIRAAFETAVAECDFVVSSGGASDGDFDYAIATLRELGELVFDSVSLRPGKAQAFGCIGNTLVQILSGNPAAAAVGFQLFGRPALLAMQGFTKVTRPASRALLADTTKKKEGRAFFQRGHLELAEDGTLLACQEGKQNSALLSEMGRSTVLIELDEGEGLYEAGTPVLCHHLDIDEGVVI